MKKRKTTYSFLTKTGFRTPDIKAFNPKQAYKIALNQSYKCILTKSYIKYDKDGLASLQDFKSL